MSIRKEYGDFQTPDCLATTVTRLAAQMFGTPDLVVEPTAGLGAFLRASLRQWGDTPRYEGYEINREYVERTRKCLEQPGITLHHRDFFQENWKANLNRSGFARPLVIGNLPWVTNSELGQLGSTNLPQKSNFQKLRGFDARTGKSNFDIAEWMLIQLVEALPPEGGIAMLCKTMTARKALRYFWKANAGRECSRLFRIDAKSAFDVAVDACLFSATGRRTADRTATMYPELDLASEFTVFGFLDGNLVSDITAYRRYSNLDGGSFSYRWRSGIKHDAAKVMEFTRDGQTLRNGLGEEVDLEDEFLFPLLKSSDLGNGRCVARRWVLVTQMHPGEDTSRIAAKAPNTWNYLTRHAELLDARRSTIYRNRPRFSVFGIGPYSFAPWKVAISGLYKSFAFVVVPPVDGRPVMIDDTCYSLPCQSRDEARLLCELLSSDCARAFLSSLVFADSKRPITIDVLQRLSLVEVARELGRTDALERCAAASCGVGETEEQLFLLS